MDVALLLILPLVGGYYFASFSRLTRYRASREDGHRLYFRAAYCGAFLFIVAVVLRVELLEYEWYRQAEREVSQWVLLLVKDPFKGHQFPLAVVSLYAMFLGPSLAFVLNIVLPRKYFIGRAVRYDDFDRVLFTATDQRMPICVTMDNKKVYVGYVVGVIDPARDRKTLGLLPIVSGYRDEKGKINFTTDYRLIYGMASRPAAGLATGAKLAEPLQHLKPSHFEVALPANRIQSCNAFDFRAYEQFGLQSNLDESPPLPWPQRLRSTSWARRS